VSRVRLPVRRPGGRGGGGLPLYGGRQFAKGHDCVMVLAFSEREYILSK